MKISCPGFIKPDFNAIKFTQGGGRMCLIKTKQKGLYKQKDTGTGSRPIILTAFSGGLCRWTKPCQAMKAAASGCICRFHCKLHEGTLSVSRPKGLYYYRNSCQEIDITPADKATGTELNLSPAEKQRSNVQFV